MKKVEDMIMKILYVFIIIITMKWYSTCAQSTEKFINKYTVTVPDPSKPELEYTENIECFRVKLDSSGKRMIRFMGHFCSESHDEMIKRMRVNKIVSHDSLESVTTLYDTITIYINKQKYATLKPVECIFQGVIEFRGIADIMCKNNEAPIITIEYKYKKDTIYVKERLIFAYLCDYPVLDIHRSSHKSENKEVVEYYLNYTFHICMSE